MPNDMTALPALLPSDLLHRQPDGEDAASIRSGKSVGVLDDKSAFGSGIVGANTHGRARATRAGRLRAWICDHFPRFAAFVGIKRAGKDNAVDVDALRMTHARQLEALQAALAQAKDESRLARRERGLAGLETQSAFAELYAKENELLKVEESLQSTRTEFAQLLGQLKASLAQNEADRLLIEQLGKDLATQALNRDKPQVHEEGFDVRFPALWSAQIQGLADEVMALANDMQHEADARAAGRFAQDTVIGYAPTGKHFSFHIPGDSELSSDETDLSGDEADVFSDGADVSIGDAGPATFAVHADGASKMDESWDSDDSGCPRSGDTPVDSDAEDIRAEAPVPRPRSKVTPLVS
ncbi:hypothetical protein [Bordetella sp. LUAb4]|uniref:hypothetical protein n=1 Tax=Bordetella sp. LUAb4 TaxID=2843195 RepID=UPI001E5EB5E3|nr:hypothetical protein [Bordetella sp. LUAb4]